LVLTRLSRPEDLRRLLQPTTRFIVVNFPHSPTGFVPDQGYLEQLIALADDTRITVICDEIYRGLPLTDAGEPPSLADLSQGAVVVNSVSKSYGLPGLRVGWVATRTEEVLVKVKQLRMHVNSFVGAPFSGTLPPRVHSAGMEGACRGGWTFVLPRDVTSLW